MYRAKIKQAPTPVFEDGLWECLGTCQHSSGSLLVLTCLNFLPVWSLRSPIEENLKLPRLIPGTGPELYESQENGSLSFSKAGICQLVCLTGLCSQGF